MTTLYIAEKPDIGKAIATYLWPDGSAKREKNYIAKGDTIVAWAAGHILRQAMPEEYDPEYKNWSYYEIFPKDWKLLPSADKKDLLTSRKPTSSSMPATRTEKASCSSTKY